MCRQGRHNQARADGACLLERNDKAFRDKREAILPRFSVKTMICNEFRVRELILHLDGGFDRPPSSSATLTNYLLFSRFDTLARSELPQVRGTNFSGEEGTGLRPAIS